MKKYLILAFDIERSGNTNLHDTIGIGASVIDNDFNELDSLFLPCYFPKKTNFAKKTWDEFWSKNEDILKQLTYTGKLSKKKREKEMINQFQIFRKKWEDIAKKENKTLYLVSDNNIFDGGFINTLIYKHCPEYLPLPYNTSGEYCTFFETHSMQKGLLLAHCPKFEDSWGLTEQVNKLFNVPKMKKEHDHNPANDAYTIAFEMGVLLQIQSGKISKK